jgi:hypothetical protein
MTSQVFINPTAMTADNAVFLEHTREIRNVAANIKNIVNQNEGWTIVGWYRKGKIVDASAKPNDAGSEITSDNHPIHVSYLYPTKPSCLHEVRRYPRGEDATTGTGN